jgi:2'-5' RNA ligase
MEQIRAFIAIELPEKIKVELEKIEARLKLENPAPAKWVEPDSIHLTLKFLGNIAADRTGEIIAAMKKAAGDISPFQLKVEGPGVFPNPRRVQVAWVGLGGELETLGELQERMESEMEKLGFTRETRKFTPHLTLARVRDQATPDERQRLGKIITEIDFKAGNIDVNTICLMKSQLTRQGAIYTRIGSVSLKKSLVNP